jgi:hypothetical protein
VLAVLYDAFENGIESLDARYTSRYTITVPMMYFQ